jgi:hypothetical protein
MSNIILMDSIRRDANKLPFEKRVQLTKMVFTEHPDAVYPKRDNTIIQLEKVSESMLNKLNNFIATNIKR